MDDAAPITWFIDQINAIVSAGANSTASAIASAVAPLAAVCFGIYIILVTVNYMRGAGTEPVMDFAMRMAGAAVVIGLGLNASNYTSIVIPVVTGLGSDLASAVSGGTASAGTLDQLALHYFTILADGYTSAKALGFPGNIGPLVLYFFKALCILIGLVPFLVAATLTLVVSNVGAVLIASVGPLFFAFLIFPPTRQYFSAWVNAALSHALVPLFVAVVAVISTTISTKMFSSGSGSMDDVSLKAVFLASVGNLCLLFILKHVSAVASSLSAGGINVSTQAGLGSMAKAARSFGAGTARDIRGGMKAYQFGKGVAGRMANRLNSIRKAG